MKKAKIFFEKWNGPMFDRDCYVLDEKGNIIAECEQGETAIIECDEPKVIRVKMSGFLNKPKIEIKPGKTYEVTYGAFTYLFDLPPRLHIDEKEK